MGETYYRFVDDQGRVHIVDRLELVPAKYRDQAKPVALDKAEAIVPPAPAGRFAGPPSVADIDGPSFIIGFGSAVAVLAFIGLFRRRWGPVVRIGAVVGAVVLLTVGYLGWLRRAAGLGDSTIATPQQLLEDAKEAAEQMKARLRQQQKALQELEDNNR